MDSNGRPKRNPVTGAPIPWPAGVERRLPCRARCRVESPAERPRPEPWMRFVIEVAGLARVSPPFANVAFVDVSLAHLVAIVERLRREADSARQDAVFGALAGFFRVVGRGTRE